MARSRRRIRVKGIVQGVGFRPTCWRYATSLDLAGRVWNEGADLLVEVEGEEAKLERFIRLLRASPPPLARIVSVEVEVLNPLGSSGFSIDTSAGAATTRFIAPDMASCEACLEETFNPSERRYLYPFTNCTDCGPRYTIVKDLPYDRVRTSMADFPLCPDCKREYEDPSDRRFHAQPIACPKCGPWVYYTDGCRTSKAQAALQEAVMALLSGKIVAIKGLGGYHLACLAEDRNAVRALRLRKQREAKPFAIMVPDLNWAERLIVVNQTSRSLLLSPQRPIVLARRSPNCPPLPEELAPGLNRLGVFLPYTPLHAILLKKVGRPLIMTSANLSDEPICYKNEEAQERLRGIADAFLHHNRPIVRRCEDSVCSVFAGKPVVLRRARGYSPCPIPLVKTASFSGRTTDSVILAVGGHLKNTFCLLKGSSAFLSPHIGDLHHASAFKQFHEDVMDFLKLLDVEPQAVACDMHPDYASTAWAEDEFLGKVPLLRIQHHHAHIVSCLAENLTEGPALGVAFDGLGMGLEGELWGGEFLLADTSHFQRLGKIEPLLLVGGEKSIRETWRVAASALYQLGGEELLLRKGSSLFGRERAEKILSLLRTGSFTIPVSSAGRLFDCVSALCGLALKSSYEGEAAMRLEDCFRSSVPGPEYRFDILEKDSLYVLSWKPCLEAVLRDLEMGASPEVVSSRFHRGLALALRNLCLLLREKTNLNKVALSGGVFQNKIFTELALAQLRTAGFEVLFHREIPPGDGGISLGQAVVADRLLGHKAARA